MGKPIARQKRIRRQIELTLSDEAHVKLDKLSRRRFRGNRSALVERLIMACTVGAMLVGCAAPVEPADTGSQADTPASDCARRAQTSARSA